MCAVSFEVISQLINLLAVWDEELQKYQAMIKESSDEKVKAGCEAEIAKINDKIERLDRIIEALPIGEPQFPADYLTDQTERMLAAEQVREQILKATREELPHATAVVVEGWREREDGLVEIDASIIVERETQKKIVIGRNGELLKRIGIAARRELEQLLERRLHLRTWVKVRRQWRDDEKALRQLGLDR